MTTGAVRLVGIDAWRAGLALFGILLHALPDKTGQPVFIAIDYASSHFRMGAFMIISGFLTGRVTTTQDAAKWLSRRFRALAVPTVTGLVLTVPLMAMLNAGTGKNPSTVLGQLLDWHHMWFLGALMLYLPIAVWMVFADGSGRAVRWLLARTRDTGGLWRRSIAVTCLSAFGMLMLGGIVMSLLTIEANTITVLLPLIFGYAPLYAAGLILGREPQLCREILSNVRLPLFGMAVVIAVELIALTALPRGWTPFGILASGFSRMALPVFCAILILRSAISIEQVPIWVARLSEASFTIYLVHYPIVKILQAAFRPFMEPHLKYAVIVVIASILSWSFHLFVVARSRTLLWLFNGKPRPPFGMAPQPS